MDRAVVVSSYAGAPGRGSTRHRRTERRRSDACVGAYALLPKAPAETRRMSAAGDNRRASCDQNRSGVTSLLSAAPALRAREQDDRYTCRGRAASGVIEEGHGAWCFPVVLAKKRDGSARFYVDYWRLNQAAERDVYPLPRIDETIETVSGAAHFTTLDLHSGYWQVEVEDGDKDNTAFATRRGLYRFDCIPFGLSNALGMFQRLMDAVLRGLWVCALVYLDDVIVFFLGSIEWHVVEVAAVLERLDMAFMTLNVSKCTVGATSIEYLSHHLGPDGVRSLQRLVTAVEDFPVPEESAVVKRFAHLAGYYKKFVPHFSTLAAPLTWLLRKDAAWQWGSEQHAAYEALKQALITKPVLQYPDFARPFVLNTDALQVDLGAALMQDVHGKLLSVASTSSVNSKAESNYSVTELECLAVVWAAELFRLYVCGR